MEGRRSQPRFPGRWSGRRAALFGGVVAAVCLVGPVATASGFDATLVNATAFTVNGPQAPVSVTFSDLMANEPPYDGPSTMEQNGPAGPEQPASLPGEGPAQGTWSLASVLSFAGVLVPEIRSVVVYNGDSPENPLSQADLEQPSDFANRLENPVIAYYDSDEAYYRPSRPDDSVANATDTVTEPTSSPNEDDAVDVQVFEAKTFAVTISAPTTSVSAGASISFAATTQAPAGDPCQAPAGNPCQYYWTVDGVTQGTDPRQQSLAFPASGSYQVDLEVTDASTGEIGAAAPITVDVTAAAQPTTTQAGTSTAPVGGNGSAASGPSQSTGTTEGASPGVQTTPAPVGSTGTQTTGASSVAPTSSAPVPTTTTPAQHRGRAPATTRPSARATAPAGASTRSPPSPAGTASRSSAAAVPTPTAAGPQSSAASRNHRPARTSVHPRRRSPGKLVSGVLVADVLPGSAASTTPARAGASAADAHAPALAPAARTSRLDAVLAGVGVLALLGLGVGRELRGRRLSQRRAAPRTA